jgi:hypothetical protein
MTIKVVLLFSFWGLRRSLKRNTTLPLCAVFEIAISKTYGSIDLAKTTKMLCPRIKHRTAIKTLFITIIGV